MLGKSIFLDLHPIQKVSFNSSLDNYFYSAPTSWHCKNFGAFLVKALPVALLCQELLGHEQLWGEVRGLSGSYAHYFREVIIHGYFV